MKLKPTYEEVAERAKVVYDNLAKFVDDPVVYEYVKEIKEAIDARDRDRYKMYVGKLRTHLSNIGMWKRVSKREMLKIMWKLRGLKKKLKL